MEVLQDESKIGMHVALTPIWSETAWFADYVLPMGLGTERHDTMSQETHAGRWLGFRQPVTRVAREKKGEKVALTHESNPGEVWEETRVLDRALVEDRSRRLAGHPQVLRIAVPARRKDHGRRVLRLDFRELGPGPARSRGSAEGLTPLQYMRKYGAFQVDKVAYSKAHEQVGGRIAPGVVVDGIRRAGFNTPSRKLEFYSPTLAEWGWPEHAIPRYAPGHVYWRDLDRSANEFDLLPNFRLPTLIHTRSPVKWLYEISHNNPLWIATGDAAKLGIEQGDLVKVKTGIGHFVTRAWVTEGIRPGVVGMSHHLGRWRLNEDQGGARVATSLVKITAKDGRYEMKQVHGAQPFESNDPDSARVWWSEIGVHQNITFPVQPDPVSGMHCWHQRVTVEKAGAGRQLRRHRRGHERSRIGSTRSGWRRRGPRPGRTARAGPTGSIVRSGRSATRTRCNQIQQISWRALDFRQLQGRHSLIAFDVRVGAMLEQHTGGLELSVMQRHEQRRPSRRSSGDAWPPVARVDVGAKLDQGGDDGGAIVAFCTAAMRTEGMTASRGQVQRRAADGVLRVDIGAFGHEAPHGFQIADPRGGRHRSRRFLVERRAAAHGCQHREQDCLSLRLHASSPPLERPEAPTLELVQSAGSWPRLAGRRDQRVHVIQVFFERATPAGARRKSVRGVRPTNVFSQPM